MLRSISDSVPAPVAVNSSQAHGLLIAPFERFTFALLFVTATGVGSFLVRWVLHLSLQSPLISESVQAGGTIGAFVSGIGAGVFVGGLQWLVLRRYLPDWLWILASTAGYGIVMPLLFTWQQFPPEQFLPTAAIAQIDHLSPPIALMLQALLSLVVAAACTVWLGLAQWFVVRQFTRSSQVWIVVPSIGVFLSGFALVVRMLTPWNQLPLAVDIFSAGISGLVQAIVFCTLLRKRSSTSFPFAIAPEIRRQSKLKRLAQRLHAQLQPLWQSDLPDNRPLSYLVGVDDTGTIVACEPENSWSLAAIDHTPIPQFIETSHVPEAIQPRLARFHVIFRSAGQVRIRSWRGVPLVWLALGLVGFVLAASTIVGVLGIHLPDLD